MVLGGLMGDFVKGRLGEQWPQPLRAGLQLHRHIDRFTDAHPVVVASRARIPPPRRRYAGIVIDVCFDHFLARDFERWSGGTPLAAFTADLYALLLTHHAELPGRLHHIAPRMAAEDWLGAYAKLDNVGLALDGISRRSPRIAPMAGAIDDVRTAYAQLQEDFERFFPALVRFAALQREQATSAD